MGAPDLRTRLALIGVAALVALAGAAVPAQAQTSSEPTEVVDVDDFADRARQWSEARRRAREEALRKAEELANQARTTTTTTTAPPTLPTPTTEPTTTTTTTTRTTTTTTTEPPTATSEDPAIEHPIPDGTTEAQWHALRQCESTQNYRAISVSGRYGGAYQFSIRTWNWVAGEHYPDLVEVDPTDASPSDQDKMAYKLHEINGWDPWPTCKKRLPS